MEQIEIPTGQGDYFGFGELRAGAVSVDVAADGCRRCDGIKGVEDGGVAYVAAVEDVVAAIEE